MPIAYARALTGHHRTIRANKQLGWVLAFVAGAINAGGFLAVQQYTSHVTGMVSSVADNLALGHLGLVVDGTVAVLAFLLGAVCCSLMVNFARRKGLASEFALPLLLEATLILVFGLMGSQLALFEGLLVPVTVLLLCFIMGLQNAVVTHLSNGVIRTTHLTGTVTDLGIEIGKLLYWNRAKASGSTPGTSGGTQVVADRERLAVLAVLALSFLVGGMAGAFGFKWLGYVSTVPLAVLLAILAVVPLLDDLRRLGLRAKPD